MAGKSALQTIKHILRLWRMYAHLDLVWISSDRKQFLIYFFSDTLINISAVTATLLIAERFDGIGIWSKFQIIFLIGYAITVSGITDTFLGYNVLFISRRLGRGQFDHVLIQPLPIWMALLTEGFIPFSASASLVPGIGLMIWAGGELGVQVSGGWLLLLLVNLLASTAVVTAFSFIWGSLAFWAPRAAEEISSSANHLMSQLRGFPYDGMGALLLGGLLSVLPAGFVAWYPARALLGIGGSLQDALVTPFFAGLLSLIALIVFRKGLQHYGRTGSQRYLPHGHRG